MSNMKTSLLQVALSFGLCVGVFFVGGRSFAQETPNAVPAAAETRSVTLPIEGMVCGACVANAKRTLKAVDGVKEVQVSLEKRQALVRYDSSKTSPEKFAAAIHDVGYKPGTPVPEAK